MMGIDRVTDTMGIKLAEGTLGAALQLLLDQVGGPDIQLDFDVRGGSIVISTKEDLDSAVPTTEIYDVRDLMFTPPSFEGTGMGGMGMM